MSAVVSAEDHDPRALGSLEERYRQSAAFRAASDQTRVTPTHVHIAVANGLGWGFDGMDGVIFALASPLVIKEFGLSVPEYRSGLQIALLVGIVGMFAWPWLADRYGRRTLLAINIALFSLMMPVLAICHDLGRLRRGALRGQLRPERRVVARVDAGGRNLAGAAARAGHRHQPRHLVLRRRPGRRDRHLHHRRFRLARRLRGAGRGGADRRLCAGEMSGIALLGAHAGPQDAASPMHRRGGLPLSAEDQEWVAKAKRIPLRQLFLPDMRRNTAVATFIACCSTTIYGTVGGWMPLYLSQERHWSTATYGQFYIWWGLVGFLGLLASGWISDRFGRQPAFYVMLAEGAVFITLWVFATTDTELWIYGLLWSIGFLGFWGPSMILTAEVFPTRIRGVGNGFSWSVAWVFGFVLWPFLAVGLQQHTGSFAAAFLLIPAAMACMALGVWWFTPDHAGKDLDQIAT